MANLIGRRAALSVSNLLESLSEWHALVAMFWLCRIARKS
jgi:hypothetical protein